MYTTQAVVSLVLATFAHASAVERRAVPGGVLAGAPVNGIRVDASGVDQCNTATISWTGTTGNVKLEIGTGGYYASSLNWIDTFTDISSSSQTWTVDQKAGSSLIFQVTDSTGQVAYKQNVAVGQGDDWCLGGSASAASSPSPSPWSEPAPASPSAAAASSPAWTAAPESPATSSKSKWSKSRSSTTQDAPSAAATSPVGSVVPTIVNPSSVISISAALLNPPSSSATATSVLISASRSAGSTGASASASGSANATLAEAGSAAAPSGAAAAGPMVGSGVWMGLGCALLALVGVA